MSAIDAEEATRSRDGGALGWATLLLTLLAFLWDCLHNRAHIDDAYISYRYAMNLVTGNGLV